MKKIYSFVLMAAALLIGANAWAQTAVTVTGDGAGNYSSLQAAVNAIPAGGTATITLQEDLYLDAPVVIPQVADANAEKVVNRAMQHITLDLKGHDIGVAGTYYGSAIILFKGELNIVTTDGEAKISRSNVAGGSWAGSWGNFSKCAIVVCGADGNKNTPANDRSKQEWSILTIGQNVTVESLSHKSGTSNLEGGFGIGIQNFNSSSFSGSYAGLDNYVHYANLGYNTLYSNTNNPMWWHNGSNAGAAFGVKVIVAGTVKGFQRGINVVGTVNQSAKMVENADKRITGEYPYYVHNYPYIKIEKGATVECSKDNLESGNGGIYAGGWTVIDILGTAQGQTGVLLKGGDAVVNGGTVKSTSEAETAAANANYGGTVSGNAIFIASASNYAGATSISIEGGATIDTDVNGGAAIVDKVATNTATASTPTVEHVTIVDGTLDGGISITDGTAGHTTIINATVEDGITINGSAATPQQVANLLVPGSTNVDETPVDEPDYKVTVPTGTTTIVVEPNLSKVVTMNSFGFSTFSTNVNRKIKATDRESGNLKAYTAEYGNGETLTLHWIEDGIIPANTGIILYGQANATYTFETPSSIDGTENINSLANNLKPETAWNTRPQTHTFFVLHDNQMYQYVGATMKEHKAYLDIDLGGAPAPQRMRMVIAETEEEQQTEAVSNVETATVKAVKFMENGEIFIRRGENVYNLQGQIVK